MAADFFSACDMMPEEDDFERPPNENSHAFYFIITYMYNGCDLCLLTTSAILVLPKCLFKDGV